MTADFDKVGIFDIHTFQGVIDEVKNECFDLAEKHQDVIDSYEELKKYTNNNDLKNVFEKYASEINQLYSLKNKLNSCYTALVFVSDSTIANSKKVEEMFLHPKI